MRPENALHPLRQKPHFNEWMVYAPERFVRSEDQLQPKTLKIPSRAGTFLPTLP
jgi:hypothetical protein